MVTYEEFNMTEEEDEVHYKKIDTIDRQLGIAKQNKMPLWVANLVNYGI